jgi:hypothetical protein
VVRASARFYCLNEAATTARYRLGATIPTDRPGVIRGLPGESAHIGAALSTSTEDQALPDLSSILEGYGDAEEYFNPVGWSALAASAG